MQNTNPFELILSRLNQLQSTVNALADNNQKSAGTDIFDPEKLLDLTEAGDYG